MRPSEVGPVSIQEPNGVIDIVVEDEAEATAAAKNYLSYFQGRARRLDARTTSGRCATSSRRTGARSTTSAR